MPRSARRAVRSVRALMASISSRLIPVSMASPLFLTNGREGLVLEPPHGGLEQLQVHDGLSVVVVVLGLARVRTLDAEVGDLASAPPLHVHPAELAAARERECPQEDVVGVDHPRPPLPAWASPSRQRR